MTLKENLKKYVDYLPGENFYDIVDYYCKPYRKIV